MNALINNRVTLFFSYDLKPDLLSLLQNVQFEKNNEPSY